MISKKEKPKNFFLSELKDIANKNTHSISISNVKAKNKTQRNQIVTAQKNVGKKGFKKCNEAV